MQKITPCLWFNNNAQEALDFYLSVFKDAKVTSKNHYGEAGPLPAGSLLTAKVELFGQELLLLNADSSFQFSHAISLIINCKDQAEVDYYWDKLSEGGTIEMCGWVKDKFGLSWQVVPVDVPRLLSLPDKAKAQRVMDALLKMKKLDIAALEAAAK